MVVYPFWDTSSFILGGVVNLVFSMILFYLRSKGDHDTYTKSQLWGLSILAWLFFLNFIITTGEASIKALTNVGLYDTTWPLSSLQTSSNIFTGVLLLAFGLVYPRPFTQWNRLRLLLLAMMFVGIMIVAADASAEHHSLILMPGLNTNQLVYIFAIFIPVFIWISEYSRQPSKEGRMTYTILIWGFLFVIVSELSYFLIVAAVYNTRSNIIYMTIYTLLLLLTLIKLAAAMWKQRVRWSTPKKTHIGMIIFSLSLAIISSIITEMNLNEALMEWAHLEELVSIITRTFGWMIVRPILFSYGLLRYQLLGSQVKAEKILAILGAIMISAFVALAIVNISQSEGNPSVVGGAILIALLMVYPFWKVSAGFVKRLLPMSAGVEDVSIRERRNTYFMGLQTGVVKGRISDPEDAVALERLRRTLGVTEREHDLLLESISQHEARHVPIKELEEAYLIFRDGRLLAYYTGGEEEAEMDKDVVAGMFTAVTEFVAEVMERGPGHKRRMDAISYGASSLLIETERNVVLAIVLTGPDDLSVRQAMRDTLSEVIERYGRFLSKEWDGDIQRLEGIEDTLASLAETIAGP